MDPIKLKNHREGPEARIQRDLIEFLKVRNWYVKVLHGSIYQSGMPDLYIIQRRYGRRFIEVKNAKSFKFTAAQWIDFPRMVSEGEQIWVLTAATEAEYQKLFQKPNLWVYMGNFHK